MPQKSRYMIAGRPTETPPHFSATSVGSPVVPDVDMIAVSSADGRQSSPPYGSARRSRKWRTAALEVDGTFSREASLDELPRDGVDAHGVELGVSVRELARAAAGTECGDQRCEERGHRVGELVGVVGAQARAFGEQRPGPRRAPRCVAERERLVD